MSLFRSLLSSQTNSLLKIHNPLYKSQTFPSFFIRTLNSSSQIDSETKNEKKPNRKPLTILFQEAVGLCERADTSESEEESENSDAKRKLRELEREIRVLKAESEDKNRWKEELKVDRVESEQARRLSELFGAKKQDAGPKLKIKVEEPEVKKEVYAKLSPDAESFCRHLYDEGYLKKANFFRKGRFALEDLDRDYGRTFLWHAAEEFGRDHQQIAKWLCSSNLKEVLHFGCPTLAKKSVFAAKRLRKFFNIEEQSVCCKCALKDSCKFAKKFVWGQDDGVLKFSDVMRVIILYALDKAHPQLTLPDEIEDSVARLLKEVVELSRTRTSISS